MFKYSEKYVYIQLIFKNIQTPIGWRCDLSVKHFVEYIRMTCFLRFFVVVVVVAVAVGCISAKVLIGKKYFHFRCTRKVFIANF